MNDLLFELIRVSIGMQESLSRFPEGAEWDELFDMSVKQSLVGVCFVGLQRLGADVDDGFAQIGMCEDLYLMWMGMAANISIKNEVVNQQCVTLQASLSTDGFRSSILKGQGVATFYGEELSCFRQSGDIDLYVDCDRKRALDYLRRLGMKDLEWDYLHTNPKFFEDTDVELHYRVSVSRNLLLNYRLQYFFKENKDEFFCGRVESPDGCIVVPSNWMNVFYLMQHAYRHLFTEGIGLRQVMDIFFAMKVLSLSEADKEKLKNATARFGLDRFVSGMMWVLQHVFGLDITDALWIPNQREGEFLLSEIMQSGNFGKHDDRFGDASSSKANKMTAVLRRTLHLASRYPGEALTSPFYIVWHFLWKRIALLTD